MGVIERLMGVLAARQEDVLREALPVPRTTAGRARFDLLVDALNRLPRPLGALGGLGLMAYAVLDPAGFAAAMTALEQAPEPLWWILGAVLGLHFGAREAFHRREQKAATAPKAPMADRNAALDEWIAQRTEPQT
jgi:hypothetical protein